MATELAKAYVQIIPSAKGIKGMLEKELGGEASSAGESAGKSFGGGLRSGLAGIGKAAAAALGAATAAVGAFAGASVKTGMAFDSSMSQVAATMGKSMDELNDMIGTIELSTGTFEGSLRDFAQKMGAETAFSATQAADALNYMALAGYDAQQSMQALPNVLNLAAAGGIDLAAASDMVTDAQSALGLTMEESAFLVDQMAMASSKSNTSVAQLGEAILTIGGTAKNLAGGTTELSTALGILADNGVKGAEGGTALRNVILSLSAPTEKAAAALRQMGVNVYDADGNMRPLNDTFADLNKALSTMTQGEQTQVLSEIFNKVDLKSVNALLANTGERFDELSGYIDNATGAAEQMANTQMDNLAGDVTLFRSALEGAQIVISDHLMPNLRQFVKFGSSGISKIADGFKEGGMSGAMKAFGSILSDGTNMVVSSLPGFVDAGMQLLGALGAGLITNLPVLGRAALKIIQKLISGITESLPALASGALQIVGSLANGIMDALPLLAQAAMDIIGKLTEGLAENLPAMIEQGLQMLLEFSGSLRENASMLVDAAITLIQTIADGLIEALPAFIETVPLIVSNIAGIINDNAPKLLETAAELIWKLVTGLIDNIPVILANMPQIIAAIWDTVQAINWMNLGKNIMDFFGSGIKSMFSGVKNAVSNVLKGGIDYLKGLPKQALSWGSDMLQGFIDGITSKLSALWDSIKGIASGITSFLHFSRPDTGPLRDYETWMPDFMQGLAQGIDSNVWRVQKAIKTLTQDMDLELSPSVQMPSLHAAAVAGTGAPLGGGTVTNLYQTINTHDSLSESEMTREAEDMLERSKWGLP